MSICSRQDRAKRYVGSRIAVDNRGLCNCEDSSEALSPIAIIPNYKSISEQVQWVRMLFARFVLQ